MKLSAIILAAGMSTRMGSENKLLLKHKDTTLLNETILQLSHTNGIDEIIIVLGHEAELVRQYIQNKHIKTVVNEMYQTGQTSSIQTGVLATSDRAAAYMICLGDMPFIQTEDYEAVIHFWNQSDKGSIIRPWVDDKPGHPVIFDATYKNNILSETYADGCRSVISSNKKNYIKFESTNRHYLVDIDTPEDKVKLI